MRIAHLLLTHVYNDQLERLISRITHKEADIYIHVDLKTPVKSFAPLQSRPGIFFINRRVKVYWGAFSIVQATINGFEEIMASGKEYGYINLLSGQDYPLQTSQSVQAFFTQNPGKAFMEFYPVNEVWTEAIPRITKYHLANYPFAGRYAAEKWMNKLLPERKMPYRLQAVGRSQWFSIAPELVKYILRYIKTHPRIVHFFKFSWAPDELFFQTILYNSPYRGAMVNNNLRYIDWSEKKASPKTFTTDDLPKLLASGKLYARKFNTRVDARVLDEIDVQINSNI
ncbi:MAG TPA: beta-1,6-N-acetylglucosaminyltransferase [Chitinophagaceae bacterium]|nr:beta-1,6-N-acetylglucosaminyltransferase [Chitinophagaceae bacterium]